MTIFIRISLSNKVLIKVLEAASTVFKNRLCHNPSAVLKFKSFRLITACKEKIIIYSLCKYIIQEGRSVKIIPSKLGILNPGRLPCKGIEIIV